VTVTPQNAPQPFHISTLTNHRSVVSAPDAPVPMDSGQCSCTSTIVASGPWGEIIVGVGENGQVISVVTACSSGVSCKQHQ
jgi:hypothetical protein